MKNQEDIAIKVEGVYKDFDLPHEAQNSLKTRILHPMSKGKNIEKQHALKDISFEIKKGEFFGIVGRNGSGKSTLLKILAEIYTPTKGKVTVNGSLTPFIELGVGFNPELTGRENVYLNGAMLGFSTKEMEQMYDEIVEFAELEKFMDQKLKNYSSGMQVRLAFSVAIRAKSDILLLDEVLAVGDSNFQRKCLEYFIQLKREGRTVILVSHDMSTIKKFCTKCLLIDNSIVTRVGAADVVASEYQNILVSGLKVNKSKGNLSGEERWGDNKGKIVNVKTKPIFTDDDLKIIIDIRVKALQDIEDPIVGFSIKNDLAQQLFGTNSIRLKQSLPPLKKGASLNFKWEMDNSLNEGEYYIDATLAHDDASLVADRWPEAASFKVYNRESTPYLIKKEINLKIMR